MTKVKISEVIEGEIPSTTGHEANPRHISGAVNANLEAAEIVLKPLGSEKSRGPP